LDRLGAKLRRFCNGPHKARAGVGIQSLWPYDLRHAFASLQIRAGMSVPELAEELKGEPIMSLEEQIELAREERPGRSGDADAASAEG
jgi:integrase